MRIHREGIRIILFFLVTLSAIVGTTAWFGPFWLFYLLLLGAIILFVLVLQFFRNPKRQLPQADDQLVYAPADGKIVVIEETEETEYFKDRRIQVSIFMSIFNAHINRHPVSGTIVYYQYHPGNYTVAWHPKASSENERATIVYKGSGGTILVRQIAGAVARRIITYADRGKTVQQGGELGFIRFGSRVDVFLPLDATLNVQIGDQVKGKLDVLARLG